jgi:hypothetical protein
MGHSFVGKFTVLKTSHVSVEPNVECPQMMFIGTLSFLNTIFGQGQKFQGTAGRCKVMAETRIKEDLSTKEVKEM